MELIPECSTLRNRMTAHGGAHFREVLADTSHKHVLHKLRPKLGCEPRWVWMWECEFGCEGETGCKCYVHPLHTYPTSTRLFILFLSLAAQLEMFKWAIFSVTSNETFLCLIPTIGRSGEKKKNSTLIEIFIVWAHIREIQLYSTV
jgi:hypothetical protein